MTESLNKDQVTAGKNIIKDMMPYYKYPIWVALPFLAPLFPNRQSSEAKGLRQGDELQHHKSKQGKGGAKNALTKIASQNAEGHDGRMQVEEPEDPLADLEPGEDPLDRLGYGMKSYFNLINYVTWIFLFLTIVNWPIYSMYSSYDYYATSASASYILGSMGNMGFSSTECQITRIQAGETVLNCPTGVISEIVAYGVSLETENINLCNYNSTGTCNSVTSTSSSA
jgi:hypothetical protein